MTEPASSAPTVVTPPAQSSAPPQASGKAESLRTIAGLLAVAVGLAAIALIALVGMGFVKTDNPSVVSIATSSFGVIGTIVGAYFGVKVGTDGTTKALEGTQAAIEAVKNESAKATAFASHMDPASASKAIADYHALLANPAASEAPSRDDAAP